MEIIYIIYKMVLFMQLSPIHNHKLESLLVFNQETLFIILTIKISTLQIEIQLLYPKFMKKVFIIQLSKFMTSEINLVSKNSISIKFMANMYQVMFLKDTSGLLLKENTVILSVILFGTKQIPKEKMLVEKISIITDKKIQVLCKGLMEEVL